MIKKEQKYKICPNCNNKFENLFKSFLIDNKRKSVCKNCTLKLERKKVKEKKEKLKVKRKEKREKITDRKLHTVFARLIKEIYPLHCHACDKPLKKGTIDCQACHIVERGKKITTWDIRNVLPGCSSCNGFDQSHQYELGKRTNIYWGEGTTEYLRSIRLQTFQWSQHQKNELYNLFTHPPEGNTIEETRQLILDRYLLIKSP